MPEMAKHAPKLSSPDSLTLHFTASSQATPSPGSTHNGSTPDTPMACPCGSPIQSVEHVLIHCPLHTAARRRYLSVNGHPRVFHQLFSHPERVLDVLRFLEETGACAKPRASWEPG
ncbi:hypothetical protein BGY98DRAFT_994792 [Russula aff. rugulosa BPL654]|nr:hypothetical protein BGY98DRAFT_994792 [Russula aff. rugulosa BPL654]